MASTSDVSETLLNHILNGSALSDNDNILLDKNSSGYNIDPSLILNSHSIVILHTLPGDFFFANTGQKFSPALSEFSTPSTTRIRSNVIGSSQFHNSIPTKRNLLSVANDSNDDSYKRSKNLYNTRHIQNENSISELYHRIQTLENIVRNLSSENNSLKTKLNINNSSQTQENITQIEVRLKALETRFFSENNFIMDDLSDPLQQNTRTFADLFKVNEDKKITEPLHDLINILSNNEEEKRKREYNLIIFGLNVKTADTNFSTLKKLLTDIGIDHNCISHSTYLRKKDQINENAPIKIVAYDLESKYFILKSARKLREYNLRNKTKIVISQDMSEVDRQVNRKLIEKRNELNSKLNDQETFYYGIRNNKVVSINKNKRT